MPAVTCIHDLFIFIFLVEFDNVGLHLFYRQNRFKSVQESVKEPVYTSSYGFNPFRAPNTCTCNNAHARSTNTASCLVFGCANSLSTINEAV